MIEFTRQVLERAAESLQNGDALEALDVLHTVEPQTLEKLNLQLSAEYYLTKAKCCYSAGLYAEAQTQLALGIRDAKRCGDLKLYASQKRMLGKTLRQLGLTLEATEELQEAYAFFHNVGSFEDMADILDDIASLHFIRGDYEAATRTLHKEIELCQRYYLQDDLIRSSLNLTRILFRTGRFQEAETALDSVSSEELSPSTTAYVNYLRGMIRTCQLETSEARRLLQAAARHFQAHGPARDVVVCLEYLGLNEYFASNLDKAREYFQEILSKPEITASATAQTLRMLTDVYIAAGEYEKAREFARKASAAITQINERVELGALERAQARIHEHFGDQEKARDCFGRSVEMLSRIGARFELALTRMAMGQSEIYSREFRLDSLRETRQLLVVMQLSKRVTAVDALLNQGHTNPMTCCSTTRGSKAKSNRVPIVIAESREMKEVMAVLDRVKNTELSILLSGETGTGKDLLAKYLHYSSERADRPFVAVNCAAIPEALLETELFGVRKGTFTGATRDKIGLFEAAAGGTFYLDEVCDAPLTIQAKLLRVLESKSIRRLGDIDETPVDFRVIAATNRLLADDVAAGRFRRDLFYRLQDLTIELPPLGTRRQDIPALIDHFLAQADSIPEDCRKHLSKALSRKTSDYMWPGNVRELRQLVYRFVVLADASDHENLLAAVTDVEIRTTSHRNDTRDSGVLRAVLLRNDGNKARAARELGLPISTFKSRLERLNSD